jgi:hypothetical protein
MGAVMCDFLRRKVRIFCLTLILASGFSVAQVNTASTPNASGGDELLKSVPPIPVVTGGVSFNAQFEPGQQTMLIAPVILVPIGKRGLIEAEFEVEAETVHHSGTGFDPVPVSKSLEYAQFDYFLNRFVTLVAGRFAEPFNIYKERLDARWIRNLQEPPLIFAFSDVSGNGGEVRGGIPLSHQVDLNYTAYFSAATSGEIAGSARQVGLRTSLFLPGPRLEVGFSYNQKLQDTHATGFGTDLTWTMRKLPVDLRAEALISAEEGNGYWVEGAWRLTSGRLPRWLRRSQAVMRQEQYFTPSQPLEDTELPLVNTTRVFGGWNFYLTDAVRISAAYGRQFAHDDNHNLWDIGINFRFVK